MKSFDYPLLQLNEFEQVKVCLSEHKSCQVTGCGESQLAHFINGLSNGYKQKVIVTFSATKASQLYQDKVASVTRPIKELKGFRKIHLNVGESKTDRKSVV